MSDRLFERSVRDWLDGGSDRTPPTAIDAVLLAIKTTPQERDLRIPRRFTDMPSYMRLAAAIAVVAVVGAGAVWYSGQGSGGPGGPGVTPTPPSTPSPTIAPRSTQPPASFTSHLYGYTVTRPGGWTVAPAIILWPAGATLGSDAYMDLFRGPPAFPDFDDVGVAAQPIPEGMTSDAWLLMHAQQQADGPRDCKGPVDAWTDAVVGSRQVRRLDLECEGIRLSDVAFVINGKGYVMSGNRGVIELFLTTFDPGP